MDAEPNSLPQMWHTTVLGRAGTGDFVSRVDGLEDNAGDLGGEAADPSAALQLLVWISNRSGRNVLAQFGHGNNTSSFHFLKVFSLYSSLLPPSSI